jgi:hypothetical protein
MSAAPVIPLPERIDFDSFAREFVRSSDEPNPHALAEALIEVLPAEVLGDALRRCLPLYTRELVRIERQRHPAPGPVVGGPSRSPRWEQAAGVFAWRFATGPGEWKFYADFTRDEVLTLIEGYRTRAAENAAHAERHERIARLMQRNKARTVRDLGEEKVAEVFHV